MTFTNRLTTGWRISGTKNFRLSSGKLLGYYGTNLQNPSPSLMRAIIPDEGHVFIQGDQAGAEALIVAYECRRAKFRKIFELGIKPHSYTALQIFTEKFRGDFPASRYKNIDPEILVTYPEYKTLFDTIKKSQREYDLGKRVRHCLTPDHEVLTHDGWVEISNLDRTKPIACWDIRNMFITFEKPSSWYDGHYSGKLFHINENQIDQLVTPEHKLPRWSNAKLTPTTAEELSNYTGGSIPVCGYYSGYATITLNKARLVAALQADGCIESAGTARFRFVKERKRERLIELLAAGGFDYKIHRCRGVWDCRVKNFHKIIGEFGGTKVFGSWLLNWPGYALDALIDELKFWDGSLADEHHHRREVYYSAIKQNIDWMNTICRLRGRGSSPLYGEHSVLGINKRRFALVNDMESVEYNGPITCPTVSTGYFLVRRKGKISVTGNSRNYKMGPRTFQLNCLDMSAGSVNLSYSEARDFLETDSEIFPELIEWHSEIEARLRKTRTLVNLFGYPRLFTSIWSDGLVRDGCAFIPQSTVGTITNIAFTEIYHLIKKEKLPWLLLNNKHDSILISVPETSEHVERGKYELRKSLERELKSTKGEEYKMKAELAVGRNWAKWDREKNPNGMKEI